MGMDVYHFFFYPFTYRCSPKVKSAVGSLNSFLLSIHTHTHIILIFITCYMQVIFGKKIRQKKKKIYFIPNNKKTMITG